MLETLREQVLEANLELVRRGLVLYTFGNASGIDRERGLVVIKPSGVPYELMKPSDMVVIDLDGNAVEGTLRPSSDLPTHLILYKNFAAIGGVVHTHSRAATVWAQACRDIPCFGTTHADYFSGCVPLTDVLSAHEIESAYEAETGNAIVRRFTGMDPLLTPAVLVANHAPFCWGSTVTDAVHIAVVLEEVARMALETLAINPQAQPVSHWLHQKHFSRKHGAHAYYGQPKAES